MSYKHLSTSAEHASLISSYDTYLFDCDGVLWSGDEVIAGAKEVLQRLRASGKSIIFVTNNATKSRRAYLKRFQSLGIQADVSEIFSSAYASAVYLKHVLKLPEDRKVYVLGMEGIQEELEDVGLKWCGGTTPEDNVFLPTLDFTSLLQPEVIDGKVGAVLCGFDMHMSYIKLAKAYKHITRAGATSGSPQAGESGGACHFILTNDDSTFPAKGGPWPGAGSLSAPLVFSSKRTPTIIGKPHQHMLDCIEAVKPFDKSRALFVGDRLDTDIAFANKGGIKSLLVLTGISTKAEIDADGAEVVPDYLTQSLGDLLAAFQ
ncbi:p-nitrophenyl phosphatase [Ceraceosorus bombacis]|uniref:4-nitrophenylphosphatase n=1 Tax=Ceraceosorus bombacis TaxID=401625 RepID=A0A0P1BKW7_9BASI|nr:p-nitrophenyl phosphatase [Ceraceosorus bombacis]